MEECPSISLYGSDKSGLGSFYPYFKLDAVSKLKISAEDFDATPNRLIMNRLSLSAHCGQSPFIDKIWHYCLPFRENPDFDLAPVGGMEASTIDTFLKANPFLEKIRTMGVIDAVVSYRNKLSPMSREKLDHLLGPDHRVSVAYRGCMICKEFAKEGIVSEIMGLSMNA
jgi:hypothetical protein